MNDPQAPSHTDDSELILERRRAQLIAEREQCDEAISKARVRRSDALIDGAMDALDKSESELSAHLSKRARIDDGLDRIKERIGEVRAQHAEHERIRHNDAMAKRIEALAVKLKTFEESVRVVGELGHDIGNDVEAIHRLGTGYLQLDQAVLHRLRASLSGLVAIEIDLPLGRDVPLFIASETGRAEWLAVHAPARVIEEARRQYLMHDPKPQEAA
jgi:hypothetical protein